jgi:hypothetical protein
VTENFDELDRRIIKEIEEFLAEADEKKYIGDKVWTNRLKERIDD